MALGSILASIGEDLKLKIWREETSQAPLSGRRFKNIFTQSSAHQVIYTSLDFKTIQRETFLAVITRDGLLSLLEPTKADRYDDWKEIDQFWACGQRIARGMETSFKVVFQQAERPNYNAVAAGVDPNALSVAIAAMDAVKIYRVLKPEDGAYRFESPVAELTSTEGLIRDVAWSPEVWRVHDLIATASCDGFVRIYKVFTHQTRPELRSVSLNKGIQPSSNAHTNQRGTPSGIGAGLAGTSRTASGGRVDSSFGQVPHDCELIEELRHDGVWRVEWLRGGELDAIIIIPNIFADGCREHACVNRRYWEGPSLEAGTEWNLDRVCRLWTRKSLRQALFPESSLPRKTTLNDCANAAKEVAFRQNSNDSISQF